MKRHSKAGGKSAKAQPSVAGEINIFAFVGNGETIAIPHETTRIMVRFGALIQHTWYPFVAAVLPSDLHCHWFAPIAYLYSVWHLAQPKPPLRNGMKTGQYR
jgi:hypothetical protein